MHLHFRKRSFLPFLLLGALAICLGLLLYFALARQEYGHLDISVVDAYTLAPLEDAQLVFPDAGLQAVTDEAGRAQVFGLPIRRHPQQDRLLPQDWGECTLLVYREGYIPYALFYLQVPAGRLRSGPTIYLFPQYAGAPAVITVVESPATAWAEELAEKYKPASP